jgi:site-specific DNA-methyltransferase (adenine-specific)
MALVDLPYGTTQSKWDTVIPFTLLWEHYRRLIKPSGAVVLFGSQPFTSALIMSNVDQFRYCWVWEKNLKSGNLNARRRPMLGHEDIAVFRDRPGTYNPQRHRRTTEARAGNKRNSKTQVYGQQREDYVDRQSDWLMPDTVLRFDCVHNSTGKLHPNQKPVELLEYLILTYTNEGETVLDNTMGSGSTGVACVNTRRRFVGIELFPEYFEVAEARIEAAQREFVQASFA